MTLIRLLRRSSRFESSLGLCVRKYVRSLTWGSFAFCAYAAIQRFPMALLINGESLSEINSVIPGNIVLGGGIGLISPLLFHCDSDSRWRCGSWC